MRRKVSTTAGLAQTGVSAGKKGKSAADAFAHFDANRSGYLDYRELRSALKHYGIDVNLRGAAEVVAAYDDYPDGKLELVEFEALVSDIERGLTSSGGKSSALSRVNKAHTGGAASKGRLGSGAGAAARTGASAALLP